jgi:S-DNA-T family DNA segregation ATPase FtsK/SpoIIIE
LAKRKTNRTRRSSSRKRRKKSSGPGLGTLLSQFVDKLRNDPETAAQGRKTLGWALLFFGVMALIACISHFTHGKADQSLVEAGQNLGQVRNLFGQAGALVANLLVTRGFGFFGLLIPLYTIILGLVLLENDFFHFARRLARYGLFILLWGSVFLAYVVIVSQSENYELGGGVGHYLEASLRAVVGTVGVAFILVFALVIFGVITFNAELRASRLVEGVRQTGERVLQVSLRDREKSNSRPAANRKKKRPATRAKANLTSVKARANAVLAAANQPTNDTAGVPASTDSSSRGLDPDTPPVQGEQISFELYEDKGAKKTSSKKDKVKVDNEDLELVIEEPAEEKSKAPADPEIKEFVKLGEDNVGLVKGDNKVEKIVHKEDQEISLEDFEAFDPTRELSMYEMPPLALLDEHGSGSSREVNREELINNKNKIVETLKNYGIEITSIKATVGPTVTLYEIVPAPGVRISKIRNLEDDIALSLAALGIRIIAPIPGKGTIGIEVPNSKREVVSLRGVLSTEKFLDFKGELPIALGRTIDNRVFLSDLNKMPHLLIAGATGQGKSVGLNTVIASLLYKKHPAEVKFVLIDPKKVEMSLYQALQFHFMAVLPNQKDPIITDVRDAVNVLKSLCIEMDQRYDLLKKAKVRNLKEYNNKFLARKLNPRKGHFFMPYIVLAIDELADMMMTAGKEVEMPIARLAQLARAVGIHLVVATQRPSVNVITGIIKANFPARMSYRVISKVDSRTILDANGADQLIGRGDMLLSTGSDIVRIQNAFIDTPEVERLVEFISEQRGFPEPYYLPDLPSEGDEEPEDLEPLEKDSLFDDAARLVVKYQMGSASLIQRKMKLGYNRAGRIIDQLERVGIVGAHSGSKARDVLITDEAELERYLETL